MKIYFELSGNDQVTKYQTEATINDKGFKFKDNICDKTFIYVTVNNDELIIEKKGNINMMQRFKKGSYSKGIYINELGMQMHLNNFTNDLKIEKQQIFVDYDYFLDDIYVSKMKLHIKML